MGLSAFSKERIREVFISMDTDSDGHVTVEELRMGLERCGISGGSARAFDRWNMELHSVDRKLQDLNDLILVCIMEYVEIRTTPWNS